MFHRAAQKAERFYAVPAVHGRFDLLHALMDLIRQDDLSRPVSRRSSVILMGNMIDRGPDSARVLRALRNMQRQHDNLIVLKGEHEDRMLSILNGNLSVLANWLCIGGRATLRSFGIEIAPGEEATSVAQRLRAAVPVDLAHWLAARPDVARMSGHRCSRDGIVADGERYGGWNGSRDDGRIMQALCVDGANEIELQVDTAQLGLRLPAPPSFPNLMAALDARVSRLDDIRRAPIGQIAFAQRSGMSMSDSR